MYADTHDRPGLDELYLLATNASDLTVDADRTTAADHLIAAGLVGNRMGSILIHLIGEWMAADKPPRPSEYDIALRAELLWCALGVGHKKKPDLKRTRAELMNAHARAMRAVYFSLPSRMDALAIMADWARWKGVDVDLLSPALYRHLDPACPVCEGRGKMVMADAPVLGKECHACGGTGIYPQALGAHRIRDWLKDCAGRARAQRGGIVRGRVTSDDVTPLADRLRGPVEADDAPEEQARVAEHFRRSLGLGRIKG